MASSTRSGTLADWIERTLAWAGRELGVAGSSLVLVLDTPSSGVRRAFAGGALGIAREGFADYFARWADVDPLATVEAYRRFQRTGLASTRELYPELDHASRRFVDDFLAGVGITEQLSLRLPGNGTSDGYLTLHSTEPVPAAVRERLIALAPRLSSQLRRYLPRGIPDGLSPRERQTAELVALGFSNREIGAVLNVGEDTVKKHVYRAMSKLGIERRTQLAVSWTTGRLLSLPVQNA